MQSAAAALTGTHDFSSFRAAECQAKSPVKTLGKATVALDGDLRSLRVLRQRLPASHGPQHRRCARRRRRREDAGKLGERASRAARPHARRAHVRAGWTVLRRRGLRRALRPAADGAQRHAYEERGSRSAASRASPTRLAASHAGADAIGMVFWSGTPRFVDVGRAREIADALPPFVTRVGLFVDPSPADVRAILDAIAARRRCNSTAPRRRTCAAASPVRTSRPST